MSNEYKNNKWDSEGVKRDGNGNGKVGGDGKRVPEHGKFYTMLCGNRPKSEGDCMFAVDFRVDGDTLFVALPCAKGDSSEIVEVKGIKVRKVPENDYKGAVMAIFIAVELGIMESVAGTDGMKLSDIKFDRETHSWCSFWRK